MDKVAEESTVQSLFFDYPEIVTVNELCEMLAICKRTAYKLVRSNKVGSIRVGRSIRIPKKEVHAYVAKNMCHMIV